MGVYIAYVDGQDVGIRASTASEAYRIASQRYPGRRITISYQPSPGEIRA
jgi:hypothetical protein